MVPCYAALTASAPSYGHLHTALRTKMYHSAYHSANSHATLSSWTCLLAPNQRAISPSLGVAIRADRISHDAASTPACLVEMSNKR